MTIPLFLGGKILLCRGGLATACCHVPSVCEISLYLSGNSGVFNAFAFRHAGETWGANCGTTGGGWSNGVLKSTPGNAGSITAFFDISVLGNTTVEVLADSHYFHSGDSVGKVVIAWAYLGNTGTAELVPSPVYSDTGSWSPTCPGSSAASKTISITPTGLSVA